MKIIINSYIKEKVKIELWQCSQNIQSIDLSKGEDYVTDIDLLFCGVVILWFLVLLCVRFRNADKQVEHLYEKATDEI